MRRRTFEELNAQLIEVILRIESMRAEAKRSAQEWRDAIRRANGIRGEILEKLKALGMEAAPDGGEDSRRG